MTISFETNTLPPSPMPILPTQALPCSPLERTVTTLHDRSPIAPQANLRKLVPDTIDATQRDALAALLAGAHPFGIPHWRAAATADAVAAIKAALPLCGVDVMNGQVHVLAMSALLAHAIDGDGGARDLLVSTLERRAPVDHEAAALARAWRRKIDAARTLARKTHRVGLPQATALAMLEALS